MKIIEFFWPYISAETKEDAAEEKLQRQADLAAIKQADWAKQVEAALEQARQLAEQENERKRSAENKASIYLAVIAAIIPVLSSLLTDFFGDGFDGLPIAFRTLAIVLFVLGMLYLVMSGIWAFRTLAVSTHARVDAPDMVKAWSSGSPQVELVKELLSATRINRNGVNKKMDYIRMAHEFLLRTFLSFALLMLLIILHDPARASFKAVMNWLE